MPKRDRFGVRVDDLSGSLKPTALTLPTGPIFCAGAWLLVGGAQQVRRATILQDRLRGQRHPPWKCGKQQIRLGSKTGRSTIAGGRQLLQEASRGTGAPAIPTLLPRLQRGHCGLKLKSSRPIVPAEGELDWSLSQLWRQNLSIHKKTGRQTGFCANIPRKVPRRKVYGFAAAYAFGGWPRSNAKLALSFCFSCVYLLLERGTGIVPCMDNFEKHHFCGVIMFFRALFAFRGVTFLSIGEKVFYNFVYGD